MGPPNFTLPGAPLKARWIETEAKGKDVLALRIKGDSMEPEFQEGELVVVNAHVGAK